MRKDEGKSTGYWAAEYAGWRSGGLSQRAYSQTRGYSLYQFKNGTSAAKKSGSIPKERDESRPKFVALKGVGCGDHPKAAYCEIRFSGKAGIRIETEETMSQLRGLVKGLWGQC